jgi:hypothetical protein
LNLWKHGSSGKFVSDTSKTPPNEAVPSSRSTENEVPLEAGSWEHPKNPLPVPPNRDRRYGPRPAPFLSTDKKRTHSVNVSMSNEEQRLLRDFAAKMNKPFSAWARDVLFNAADIPIPARSRAD